MRRRDRTVNAKSIWSNRADRSDDILTMAVRIKCDVKIPLGYGSNVNRVRYERVIMFVKVGPAIPGIGPERDIVSLIRPSLAILVVFSEIGLNIDGELYVRRENFVDCTIWSR